ncbi:DNA-binding XRE family transcriptional regulator [Hydrogenoanaerobacterium saccharovorans]|uniref:DNA-binding transcriptional regulator, XRE-family HTH domain n=1 Tax=Hydrogenoanaerobacterium saccharovorans TaxID=474960 RepID=A0A1H8ASI5_9FIRM|nr:helix-turn-helix transcriptional regulator [Hydrogenoanaerobacterium saccharovorans]RPF47826.1 DNA-binding XRE family transcriptional regulator [Hydrogenoanaerobacterium saccharovorans]SEM72477.1 DNA-binding transcriptional regulator, XRE-family HTH domain [Hydrogenoanaerobacterium saccharovorans]
MYEKYLSERIAKLRAMKKVSARDMSLSIGQNENYINHIENGKSMPSMQVFFYICEYFNISPKEFFDEGTSNPALIKEVIDDLSTLDEKQFTNIHEIIKGLKK